MPPKSTRNAVTTGLVDFIGSGREMLETELPTLRSVLRKTILAREELSIESDQFLRKISISEVIDTVIIDIGRIWKKSNSKFVHPVVIENKSIKKRILLAWETANSIVRKRITKKAQIQSFTSKLDRLFDITMCQCKVVLCPGACSLAYCTGYHIDCNCSKDKKFPVIELAFMVDQRNKVGEKTCKMMIANLDQSETQRMQKAEKRKEEDLERQRRHQQLEDERLLSEMPYSDCDFDTNLDEYVDLEEVAVPKHEKRNLMPIKNTAEASLRYQVSSTATAVICTAFLKDLIESNHLSDDMKYLALDKKKVLRAKTLVIQEAIEIGEIQAHNDIITGVYFDGRKDNTLVQIYDEKTGSYRKRIIKEEHISVTSEPDGLYRLHFTPPPAIPPSMPANEVAMFLADWLIDHGQDKNILVLGGDSTNSMSGWKGGSIALVEKQLNIKAYWVICQVHTNELPLRHLIEKLDGKTTSRDGFSGPICKMLSTVNTVERKLTFPAIPLLEPLVDIPDKIVAEMSQDAKLSYRLVKAMALGELTPELALSKCGKFDHSRWLTTGLGLCFLWCTDHGFTGELLDRFRKIVTYVVQVYFPMYFQIKVKHSIVEAPQHIVTLLRLFNQQDRDVKEATGKYVRSGAWFAHSECLLLSLLSSSDKDDREFAVAEILKLRAESDKGDRSVRNRKTPTINLAASNMKDLIDWNKETISEPVFTCDFSRLQLEDLRVNPFLCPYYCNHTQSTERAVQQVTQAAESVCGQEKRDGYVRARIAHRETVPAFNIKKDSLKMFE